MVTKQQSNYPSPSFVDYDEFLRLFKWKQGEHVTIIGPTGSGKSTLALELTQKRRYVVLFLVKKTDSTMSRFIKENEYYEVKRWDDVPFEDKIALWPRFTGVESYQSQSRIFKNAINGSRKAEGIFSQGRWTIVIDETSYMVEDLRLEPELRMLWRMGRTEGLSVVAEAQRPRGVPLLMLSQATHLFFFQFGDAGDDLKRIAEIGGTRQREVKEIVPFLGKYEFLYNNTRTGQLVRSKVE